MRTNPTLGPSEVNNTDFLILNLLKKNRLGYLLYDRIDLESFSTDHRRLLAVIFSQFKRVGLEIHFPAINVHRCLLSSLSFFKDKDLLERCLERTGLVLMPEGLEGVRTNAIFYAWRRVVVDGKESRRLFFLPFLDGDLSPDVCVDELSALWWDFGNASFGVFGRLRDYLMSFILLNNFQQVYDGVLCDPGFRRLPALVNSNLVEVIFQTVI